MTVLTRRAQSRDPLWYKDAIIYEVPVRAFRDSNGDGRGDFRGLTEKLDYLRDLGVTAIWILPFYPSPLRDDGYDIADYTGVHPDYGALRDVRRLIREAHDRGLRVITELVCNHTSDQHPWFQRARRARPGSVYRDFYVWSDTPDRYTDARVIFQDFETSNWSWDAVAGQYYWHRFYAHQPDLNFDNPKVHEAIFKVMDFWLEMGADGLRLDAIPYLYEREGINCENLPETHEFLKALRRHIDDNFADRMLLAEANQWPEDAVGYFGNGDECHMSFHFPVMPRMFMSIRMEDRFPIVDIMEQTPTIPDSAQWALFLRNHDELTLEMVTDEERDYMYRVYAHDPQMRINLGIRRRLAPLLGNNRRRIELMNGLLFSLPGTPVVYYGDEIGMGDNVYVGDRNGVRTPMQWNGDRNAGFSSANRQQLYLPVITDPEYHYEAVNVEAQQGNPHSLLWWTKRLIDLRKRHPAFSRGSLEFVHPENRKILAFVRRYEGETILVLANLSRFVQHTELDLSAFDGQHPVELFGRVEFPPITTGPYFMTLAPHSFLWFSLEPDPAATSQGGPTTLPEIAASGPVGDVVRGRRREVADLLRAALPGRRWYRGKARGLKGCTIVDTIDVRAGDLDAVVVVLQVDYVEGEAETYLVPLSSLPAKRASDDEEQLRPVIARLRGPDRRGDRVLIDAASDPAFMAALLGAIGERQRFRGERGELRGRPDKPFGRIRGRPRRKPVVNPIGTEQSNSSVVFDDRVVLKLFRVLDRGPNPDLEIGRALTQRGFSHVPAVAGGLEYAAGGGDGFDAGIAQAYVPNEGDLFAYTVDALNEFVERTVALPNRPSDGSISAAGLLDAAANELPELAHSILGAYHETAELLGIRTAELHLALASIDDRSFTPEPFTELYQRSIYQSIHALVVEQRRLLERRLARLPERPQADARLVLDARSELEARLKAVTRAKLGGKRIRTHGDYHLGQVLHTGRDVVIIDFEGEPTRPIGERRLKRSPLRDVAGMLRSFHYAAYATLLQDDVGPIVREEDVPSLEAWIRAWVRWASAAFLRGYQSIAGDSPILPRDPGERALLLDAFLIQKAFYELDYELNSRPNWVAIPLRGIVQLLDG
ncbi:MAG: maltose alpha-D-glucosyltransferase [Chloroflexota bacterium]